MADPSITALRILRAVTDTGSFTAAAEALGYTQSAVSKQMNSLELATGAVLFHRAPRGVELTPAGRVMAARSAVMLDELDAAGRELLGLADQIVGNVALGAFPTAAMHLVPLAVRQLRRDHPGLVLTFREASSPTQLGRLRSGVLDVAVVAIGQGLADHDVAGLRMEELVTGPLRIAVAEDHPFARRDHVPVAELQDQPWVAGTGARSDPQFGAWPTLVSPHIAFTVRDWPTKFGFVAAGLGITTVPGLVSGSVPRGVRTVRVDDPSWTGRRSFVVTREDRSVRAALVAQAVVLTSARLHASDQPSART